MKSKLFNNLHIIKTDQCDDVLIFSPFGKIIFEFSASETNFLTSEHNGFQLSNEGTLHQWINKNFQLEILLTPFQTNYSREGKVEKCFACILRIKSFENYRNLEFACKLQPNHNCDCSVNGGEHIEALVCYSDKGALAIGTEDSEILNMRAKTQDFFPQRYKDYFDPFDEDKYYPFGFFDNGLSVTIPSIQPGEILQLSYIVAWTNPNQNPDIPWYVVDTPYKYVLEQYGYKDFGIQ